MNSASLQTGALVDGRFRLDAQLGGGGYGVVWKALDELDGTRRPVALKVLHPRFRKIPRVLERLSQEAEILSRLEHPSIARAVRWRADGEQPYIAMEFVAGESLDGWLSNHCARNKHVSGADIHRVVGAILAALAYAHDHGVVHRDLKPTNIMLTEARDASVVRILDFGIAKSLETDASAATTAGRFLGTMTYVAPEQVDAASVDQRADIFALGTVLFEILTLRKAWVRDTANQPAYFSEASMHQGDRNSHLEIFERICRGERPSPSEYRSGLRPEVDAVVHRAMAINPENRFADVREMAMCFFDAISGLELRADPARTDRDFAGSLRGRPRLAGPFEDTSDDPVLNAPPSTLPPVEPQDFDLSQSSGQWTRDSKSAELMLPVGDVSDEETSRMPAAAPLPWPPQVDPRVMAPAHGAPRSHSPAIAALLLVLAAFVVAVTAALLLRQHLGAQRASPPTERAPRRSQLDSSDNYEIGSLASVSVSGAGASSRALRRTPAIRAKTIPIS